MSSMEKAKREGTTPQAERPCCAHPESDHFSCEIGSFCKGCPTENHAKEGSRRVTHPETAAQGRLTAEQFTDACAHLVRTSRLTAEQFFNSIPEETKYKWAGEVKPPWAFPFAEAFRDESEAGLREEIERLRQVSGNQAQEIISLFKNNTELRAKLAEQEAKYTILLKQRYEDMSEFRFRGKTAAELTKILARAEAAEAELAALREREREGRTEIPTGDALEAYNAGYAAGKQHGK